ncbi:hypothetical protein CEXT_661751 [Caerostris extrusa]|uniref:Uncharacterized protein n=1 Tax=Caerostris extrusa TaxID=172846 RepID=A0AAV4X7R5_CAEEX|nr:hypothetical protein CEXT_661751 [Caerostris extrusa]
MTDFTGVSYFNIAALGIDTNGNPLFRKQIPRPEAIETSSLKSSDAFFKKKIRSLIRRIVESEVFFKACEANPFSVYSKDKFIGWKTSFWYEENEGRCHP